MFPLSRCCRFLPASLLAATIAHATPDARPGPVFAVCADPNNLPYASDQLPGFENRIAELLAGDLHADLRFTWNTHARSFLQETLLAGACDVVITAPANTPGVLETMPYFASAYVAITRARDPRHFVSFEDPWLKTAKIGVEALHLRSTETAPEAALMARGMHNHVTAFDMRGPDKLAQSHIVDAVADGTIDVAFVWGPIGGYFAKAHGAALVVVPITEDKRNPDLIFSFPLEMAVRPDDAARRDQLQAAIDRHRPEIAAILADAAIPTLPMPTAWTENSATQVAQKAAPATPHRPE